MGASRVDGLARALTTAPTRRAVLHGLAVVAGVASSGPPCAGRAKKHKSKVRLNEFGCVNIGGTCRGKDALCCSGICQGKKPKKGKKDTSRCVAHNVGGCTVDRRFCLAGLPLAFCSETALCTITTGNAPFCGDGLMNADPEDVCRPCRSDLECEALGFGEGSACVILRAEGLCNDDCENIEGNSGTGCLRPGR